MKAEDYAIAARVRRTLARLWIRTDTLEIGTTEGVVLLKGRLEFASRAGVRSGEGWEHTQSRLGVALRTIPGVVDIVLQLRPPDTSETPCTPITE